MENQNFMDVLMANNPDQIRDYLIENGKEPKPHCPFYFEKKESEGTDNE